MSIYLRDSRHASTLFGFSGPRLNTGTPRFKFQFFVEINFNSAASSHVRRFLGSSARQTVFALVKTATLPGFIINTQILNQYNRKRVLQSKIEPSLITLSFHDTVDGQTMRLWEMYYEYYYRDGRNSDSNDIYDTVRPRFNDNFGYDLNRVRNQRHLIRSIEISQVHNGRFSRVRAMSPTITTFTHDTLDYSASGDIVEFRMDLQPEYVVYRNRNSSLSSSALERYDRGDFWGMFDFLNSSNPVGEIRTEEDIASAIIPTDLPVASGQVSNILRSTNVSRVQQPLDGIIESPINTIENFASSSVLNGKVQQPITPISTNVSNPPTQVTRFGELSNVIGRRSSNETFDRSSILTGVSDKLDRR